MSSPLPRPSNESQDARRVLSGGGEMGALMRSIDWSSTAVGPVEQWPQSLRTALSILLETGFPMYIAWGPGFTQFYNDGYRPILGSTKHPAAMGIGTRETFAEIWDIIGPMFESVMRGKAVSVHDFLLPLDRHGFVEECYFVFSYSPIREESGDVGGVLVTVTETTERVLGARRLLTLQALGARTQSMPTAVDACRAATGVLADDLSAPDIPFALVYLLDEEDTRATLAGTARIAADTPLAPRSIELDAGDDPWQLSRIHLTREPAVIECPLSVASAISGLAQPTPTRALVLPIFVPGAPRVTGFLVAALSPRLTFDAKYRSFLDLVGGHVGSAIASARALEEAKERAAALAELDRAKTTFFSNVSHEFRTPLTLMLAPIRDMASMPAGSPIDRETVELLQRNALRLLKLVNTLLEFSRIEAGRAEAIYEPVDLSAATAELASIFRAAIERADLSLIVDCPTLPESIWVDRDMWEKIVLNLLSNALKFTFEGSITVRLRLLDEGACLEIADTGTGIAASELPRVFERFHRIEGVRARSHEGSGIGLALIQELVRLHGGEVQIESQVGRGTRFSIRIPRGKDHLPQDRVRAARRLPTTAVGPAAFVEEALRWSEPTDGASSPREGSSADGDSPQESSSWAHTRERQVRILFADDNADMRAYVGRLLRERWTVETVGDGIAALAALRRSAPDLLICDVMMPGMSGFALVEAVRSDAALRALPVIFLSARAGVEAAAEGLGAGANDYIAKPFSARDLLVRVASTLAAARVGREMREAEEAQRANLYRHFMQAPFPIAVLRGRGHVIELANPEILRVWGKGPQAIGLPLDEAVPELRGQPFIGYLDEVVRTGVAYQGREELARLPTGPGGALEQVYCNFVYAPLRDTNDAVEGVLVSAFLVTEQVLARQQTERALDDIRRERERARALAAELLVTTQRLHTAQRAAKVGIFDWDLTNQRMSWSPEIYWLMGLAPDQIEARPESWRDALLEADRAPSVAAFEAATAAHATLMEVECRLRQPSGDARWVRVSSQIEYDADRTPVRLLGAVVDIQTLKEAAAERSRSLAEAERTSRAKDEFLATMSHELRTPLNAMLGWATMLKASPLDPSKLERGLTVIERNARTQARLVNDLLDVSRIISGKLRLAVKQTELSAAIYAAIDVVRQAAEAKGVRLVVDLDPDVGMLVADPDRLQQIVWNLLSNAVKFTPPGGSVGVSAQRAGSAVQVRVQDTGHGIAPEHLPFIFERFRQIDGSITREHAGLGLGLAIVRHLVEAHGGTVAARSDGLGKGTTFTFSLPIRAVHRSEADPTRLANTGNGDSSDRHPAAQEERRLSGARVLLVEDDADSLEFLAVALDNAGASSTAVNNAHRALEETARTRFDIIISDIGMPEMDGYAFMQRVREREACADVPAIALTAYARPEDASKALRAGYQKHLTKPVDSNVLVTTIELMLPTPRRRS